jgi:hypothetical protein
LVPPTDYGEVERIETRSWRGNSFRKIENGEVVGYILPVRILNTGEIVGWEEGSSVQIASERAYQASVTATRKRAENGK